MLDFYLRISQYTYYIMLLHTGSILINKSRPFSKGQLQIFILLLLRYKGPVLSRYGYLKCVCLLVGLLIVIRCWGVVVVLLGVRGGFR